MLTLIQHQTAAIHESGPELISVDLSEIKDYGMKIFSVD